MALPRQTGTVLGATAVAFELPIILTLFILRDRVPFDTALGLVLLAPYLGAAGLVLALQRGSRVGVALSVLSLGGGAFVFFVFWALARAFS
jgi:hypothetical protein